MNTLETRNTKRRALLSRYADLREKIDELQDELDELRGEESTRESALIAVKYWLHDALVLHRPISDPRRILRVIEAAL